MLLPRMLREKKKKTQPATMNAGIPFNFKQIGV